MRNCRSSQEHPYFKTAQQCQILQVEIDGGNYWAAVTGSSSFPLASVILGCWTKMFFSILPFLSCGIPAVRTPSGLRLMQRVEPTKWSDERAPSFFICGFFVVFIYFLCYCSVTSLAEWFSVWRSWINGRVDCKYKTPRCLTGEPEIRGYGKSMRLRKDFDFKVGEGPSYTLSKLLPILS